MSSISANDLKVKGVAIIEASLHKNNEAVISVRGKNRYVVMHMDHYHYLRECELEVALIQTQADLKAGRFVIESPEAHIARLE
jgi:hypothetical protein